MAALVHPASLRRSPRTRSARSLRPAHSGRSRKLAGAAVCAALALAYLAVAWWIIFDIRIGPVVGTITETRGVHSGDFLGLASFGLGTAFALVAAMLLESGLSRPRMAVRHYR